MADNASSQTLGTVDALILCGGKGTRLQSVVSDRPKVMATIAERPFLDILLQSLFDQGFLRVILAVGYLKEHIMGHYHTDTRIVFSEESEPLGTGGAVKHAKPLIVSDHFFVLNGDSYCTLDYRTLYDSHLAKNALISIALADPAGRHDGGNVFTDQTGRIVRFMEKLSAEGSPYINAGVYVMDRRIFTVLPDAQSFSLEHDVFPHLLDHPCYGYVTASHVMDIGTPERYKDIDTYFKRRQRS
jgi:NDP-sugar pyrophosphorylase family protein